MRFVLPVGGHNQKIKFHRFKTADFPTTSNFDLSKAVTTSMHHYEGKKKNQTCGPDNRL